MQRSRLLALTTPLLVAASMAHAGPSDLDATFDGDGVASLPPIGEANAPLAVGAAADGGAWVVGQNGNGGIFDNFLAHVDAGGTWRTFFADEGIRVFSFGGGSSEAATAVADLGDGTLLVAGNTLVDTGGARASGAFGLTLLDIADITAVTTFGDNGQVRLAPHPSLPEHVLDGLRVQGDGRILLVGSACNERDGTLCDVVVTRLRADGSVDDTFGTAGVFTTPMYTRDSKLLRPSLAEDASGNLFVLSLVVDEAAGTSSAIVTKLDADGAVDATFGAGGRFTGGFGSPVTLATSLAVDDEGRVLVGGERNDNPAASAVLRLTPAGALDAGFGDAGVAAATFGRTDVRITGTELAVDSAGRVVVSASLFLIGGGLNSGLLGLARFLPTGAPDVDGFCADGRSGFAGTGERVRLLVTGDDKLWISTTNPLLAGGDILAPVVLRFVGGAGTSACAGEGEGEGEGDVGEGEGEGDVGEGEGEGEGDVGEGEGEGEGDVGEGEGEGDVGEGEGDVGEGGGGCTSSVDGSGFAGLLALLAARRRRTRAVRT